MVAELVYSSAGIDLSERFDTSEPALPLAVLKDLNAAQIPYCLLRDVDQLAQLDPRQEIDLLVDTVQLPLLRQVLAHFGFVELTNWGHWPHHFFITYQETTDTWLKLDVVTAISYRAPGFTLDTSLAPQVLANRRYAHPTYIPSPEDELIMLLLHCLLDKGHFAPKHRGRLLKLRHEVQNERYLSSLLTAYWPVSMTWTELARQIEKGDWSRLLACGANAYDERSGHRLVADARRLFDRILRKLNRWSGLWHPLTPMVAILAPDGSGKTTLVNNLQASFFLPVDAVYMGLYQRVGEARRLPPGIRLLARISRLWKRYLSAWLSRARGQLVVFDRYTYDALLPSKRPVGRLGRLRRRMLASACPAPDLVLVLDAPGQVLYARKGEHDPAFLDQQRQGYLRLAKQLPNAVVLAATQEPDSLRREATAAIWRHCRIQRDEEQIDA